MQGPVLGASQENHDSGHLRFFEKRRGGAFQWMEEAMGTTHQNSGS